MATAGQKEFEKLKRKRSTLKSSATKLLNKTDDILNCTDDKDLDVVGIEEVLAHIIEKETQIIELDKLIEDAIDDLNQLEIEVETNQEYRDKIVSAKLNINRKLKNIAKVEVEVKRNLETETRKRNEHLVDMTDKKMQVKLPKLIIEKYSGKPEEYQEFWSQFKTAIHENNALTKIDKFNYLKSLLKGAAHIAVQGLLISEENYDTAIKILNDRYGKKEILIRSHINKLLNLAPVRNASNLKELRDMYETCEIQIRSLESLDIELKSYGNLLFPIITKLIPDTLILEYNRENKEEKDSWNVSKLLEYLKSEIETRERTFSFHQNYSETNYHDRTKNSFEKNNDSENYRKFDVQNKRFKEKYRYPTAATLNANITNKCLFCNEDHSSDICSKTLSEKKDILKREGRCFNCLKKYHVVRMCSAKIRCILCHRKHNTLICEQNDKTLINKQNDKNENQKADTVVSSIHCSSEIYLQTATCNISSENQQNVCHARVLFDLGSQRSFVLQSVAENLKLKQIDEENVSIFSFGSAEPINEKRKRFKIVLRHPQFLKRGITIEVLETPKISDALISVPGNEVKQFFDLNKMDIADKTFGTNDCRISILIGSDFYWKIVTGRVKRLSATLVASETLLGFVINGTVLTNRVSQNSINVMKAVTGPGCINSEREVDTIIRKFWQLDSLGIINKTEYDELDSKILENFNETIEFKDKRYQVRLPWNLRTDEMKDNYDIARYRLKGLVRKFAKFPELYEKYKEVIDEYLRKEIAEEVNEKPNSKCYYMPHQAVIREDKSTSCRVVFDCSSHSNNSISLNDCLHTGPNLNPDLLSILIRFRQHRICFTADIQKAFLQVLLSPEDRDAVRFLWTDRVPKQGEELHFKVLQMTRVSFGLKPSPFLLAATIKYHIEKYKFEYPNIFNLLNECLYVDDLISGADEEVIAIEMYEGVKNILQSASFNMRKWKTNLPMLQRFFDEKEHSEFKNSQICKVLGYKWNSLDDVLQVENQGLYLVDIKSKNFTKREVLKIIGRIYDPIGFLSPFTVTAKILMQEIWQSGVDWDAMLPQELQYKWINWCEELKFIQDLKIPRHYFSGGLRADLEDVQLHCFTDASQKAYGAVIYVRYVTNTGLISTTFIISKTRVSPLQRLTLPRLELMAAVVGARLATYVTKQMSTIKMTLNFWTDSSVTLHWIKGDPWRWKPFVHNRVMEIQGKTDPTLWYHCPGAENPADLLTRGEKFELFHKNEDWWKGPKWLVQEEKFWPRQCPNKPSEEVDDERRKAAKTEAFQANCITQTNENPIFDITKYSNVDKIIRITAYILRFQNNAKKTNSKITGRLNADELIAAEKYWIQKTQGLYFIEEQQALQKNIPLSKHSRISIFKPFLDEDGILRVGGRLENAELTFTEKHPAILPEQSYFSDLQIKKAHEKIGHSGVAETLAQIRERFWIPRGRQKVKRIIRKCLVCQRFRARPYTQDIAPLPLDRIKEAFPFEVSGIDFAGPLYTRNKEKVYIALFTCAVTRAVHLELVADLTSAQFLLAFRRFISRRGLCKIIYSDNAKTFKKADKDIQRLWQLIRDPEVLDYFGGNRIQWKYIVERAAWWGGFWERLIRSTKTCLKKILGRASLNYQELETTLVEVEAILNSRPLTYIYSGVEEPGPLCPGHFLVGKRLTSLPPDKIKISSSTKDELTRRYKYRLNLIERFWKKWKQEYLLHLQSAHQNPRTDAPRAITKNRVVLVHDENQPRLLWRLGLITEVHQGRDGKVRACTVKLPNGTHIKRTVQHLHPLELDLECERQDICLSGPEDIGNSIGDRMPGSESPPD